MPTLLTRRQLSLKTNLTIDTLNSLQKKGRIPFVRLSARSIRFDEAAVTEALKSMVVKPANP